jgi:transcription elongation factor GreA
LKIRHEYAIIRPDKGRPVLIGTGRQFFLHRQSKEKTVVERVPMTQEAYNKRKAEIDNMENIQMPSIAEAIAEARAEGDLKENAEYHAQREKQGLLQARINELKSRLSRAQIVDPNQIPKDEVAFGATVKVLDVDLDDEEDITLVGDGDEDYDNGKYLITSPIGRGLLGKKVGETAEIEVPKGTMKFKVLSIDYNE